MLNYGVGFSYDLLAHTMEMAEQSQAVKDQMADPDTNIFTGKPFEEEDQEKKDDFDLSSIFSVDADKLKDAFSFDEKALNIDLSALSNMDLSKIRIDMSQVDLSELSKIDLQKAFKDVDIQVSQEALQDLIQTAINTYAQQTDLDPSQDAAAYAQGFAQFLASAQGRAIISNGLNDVVNADEVRGQLDKAMSSVSDQARPILQKQLNKIISQVIKQLSGQLQSKMNAAIMGVEAVEMERKVALVKCRGFHLCGSVVLDATKIR